MGFSISVEFHSSDESHGRDYNTCVDSELTLIAFQVQSIMKILLDESSSSFRRATS